MEWNLHELLSGLWENLPFKNFLNPDKRIYWPYLLLSFIYALIFILFSKNKKHYLNLRYWFAPSAKVDYAIWICNQMLQVSVLPLVFASGLLLSSKLYHVLIDFFGTCTTKFFMSPWGIVWYPIAFFILSDFSRYAVHYLVHHNRFLWHIHRMHHSAEIMTPITFFRSHPLEMMVFHIRYLIVYSLTTGVFLYLYNDFFDIPEIMGASIIVILSAALGANLRHSNIPLGFGIVEKLFISPKQHQMHHSIDPELQNSNLGSTLAIWDVLFSTWKASKNVGPIQFGLQEQPKQSTLDELVYPFQEWGKMMRKSKEKAKNHN